MLGAGKANAFSTKLDSLLHLLWSVRVGADTQLTKLIGPAHELHELLVGIGTLGGSLVLDETLDDLRGRRLNTALVDIPNESVQRKLIAFLQSHTVSGEGLLGVVDRHAVGTTNTDLPHLAGNESSM